MSDLAVGTSVTDDETLSVGAVTDVELDSTGAGSPPAITFDTAWPHEAPSTPDNVATLPVTPTAGANFTGTAAPDAGIRQSETSTPSLEAALGEVLVISGGSGFNDLVGATPGATYVMPISDNGGSSSEIIRVLGGPSIGDLRSRLNRLIPTPSRYDQTTSSSSSSSAPPPSNEAIHNLLSYRLPSHGPSREIKQEWMDILEGRHRLWRGIEPERKEVIRGFLVHFESEVLRRAHRHFNFRGGSIGNFFLAAAQKFFRSIQSAIFLFSATTQISTSSLASKVLPVINTNHTATIAAELEDGEMIVGQCEISHPAPKPIKASAGRKLALAGEVASQPPGTPSSAIWDPQQQSNSGLLSAADAMQGLGLGDGGPTTPGFGPPAHYHINEPFASASASSYTSAGVSSSATPARSSAAGPSPLFAQLVEERASAYAAQARKGLTTVGNQKDGLDPEGDDQDSQDGHDQVDSPREDSAAEDDHALDKSTSSLHAVAATPRSKSTRNEKTGNIIFSKAEDESSEPALPSPIRRILYVNAYRNEIYPAPNPSFVTALSRNKTIIYSCGSLWTSIVPCLSLRCIATSIATSPTLKFKVLLLNSVQDRETKGMDALDFVKAICGSLNQSDVPSGAQAEGRTGWAESRLITHLIYFEQGQVGVDVARLEEMGIRCVVAESRLRSKSGTPKFDEESVREALRKVTSEASS
ncbi:hypothetical protein EX895_003960 [Sporisorium graminicola]|uniref:Uncharacterized protein n=1 Tax=Sporisorium graminicola TaxID=280036 RepID=A0A4U7KSB6_9BASI|nr:hypothetical protein EX895_003960 [Sporisorium graminicola]TKY87283.1 hypothetical protein EX895_003960 [Sporisorium graminicola]